MKEYENQVNIDGVYTIVKKGNAFVSEFIEFNFDEKLEKEINDLRKHLEETSDDIKKGKISFENCKQELQNKIYELIKKIENKYPDFFQVRSYVDDIGSPYNKMEDYLYTSWNQITTESKSILSVSSYFPIFLDSYKHRFLQKSLKSMGVLAYSHRKAGFNSDTFNMDDNFKTVISTNFGYGYSSYFILTIRYMDIPIIPYTTIIYYQYANASTVLHFTREYKLRDGNWIHCFDFAIEVLNEFYNSGARGFISNHIVKSLEELIILLSAILKNDTFYFVDDLHKLNTLLGIKNKQIVYDYEHLLENENPKAINQEQLKKLAEEVKKIPPEKYAYAFDRAIFDYAGRVFNENAINNADDFLMARYYYAISTVLSKSIQLDEWDTGSYNIVTRIMSLVIKDYKALVYKKAGFNLISFRNERIILSLKLFGNIKSFKNIIDGDKYIKIISELAELLLKQNDQFLSTLSELIKDARDKYQTALKEYENYKSKFEASDEYKKYTWFTNTYYTIGDFLSKFIIATDKQDPKLLIDETLLGLTKIYSQIKDNPIIKRLEIFALSDYGNSNDSNIYWSIKRFRDIYSNEPTKENLEKMGVSMGLTKTICEIVALFDYEQESSFNKKLLLEKMDLLKSLFEQMKNITTGHSYEYEKSLINFYLSAAGENNDFYIKYRKDYNEKNKMLIRLCDNKNALLKALNELEKQEEHIKTCCKEIEELKKG